MTTDVSGLIAKLQMEISDANASRNGEMTPFSELSEKVLGGMDLSKVDINKVLVYLCADMSNAQAVGGEMEPSQETLAVAGLTREEFVLISEKVVANFSKHTETGKYCRELIDKLDGNSLGGVKTHLHGLFESMTRKEVSKLSKRWNVNLQHFKCISCDLQQKDCDKKLLRCGGCGEFFYCSKVCQKIHWREGKHRNTCAIRPKIVH